jgi:hypothetical protein
VNNVSNQILKNDVISMAKIMLPQTPFNTIYSYADNLFDLKELPFNDPSIQKQVDFLKNAKLSDIEYSGTDKADFFTMRNRSTGDSIQVSNRASTRGELRGEKLRDLLDQQRQKSPDEVAFNTITRAIRTAESSDMYTMLKGAVSSSEGAKQTYGTPMSNEHFELFTAMLLGKVHEKIKNELLADNLEPKAIRQDSTLQDKIWDGIDVAAIYDATEALALHLQQIKTMSESLSNRGYAKAASAAVGLYNDLRSQNDNLIQGKIPVEEFSKNCNQIVEQAQQGELKNHRGLFGSIWHGIKVALNAITFGAVSITPTKSIEKTIEMKNAINHLVDSAKLNPSPQDVDESPKPSL